MKTRLNLASAALFLCLTHCGLGSDNPTSSATTDGDHGTTAPPGFTVSGTPPGQGTGSTTGSVTGGTTGDANTTGNPNTGNPNASNPNTSNPNTTNPNIPVTPPAPVLGPASVNPNSPWLTYVGRFDLQSQPGKARCAYAGSAIRANFRGTSLTVNLAEEIGTAPTDIDHNWFNVYVDGVNSILEMGLGSTSYVFANLAADTNHTVVITKRTDPSVGVTDFMGMSTNGNFLQPPAGALHRIEVIGASETSGYGVDGDAYGCANANFYESFNGDHAYAAEAGDDSAADVINLGYSGKGIVRNYSLADNVKTLPYMYPRTLPDDPNSPLWNAAAWQADVVVLDTGGCDFTIGSPVDPNVFIADFVTFVHTIRTSYPKALVVIAMDTLYEDISGQPAYRTELQGYFSQIITELNDPNVLYFAFPGYTATYVTADGWGCNGHPDQLPSVQNGQLLANEIRTKLGW